ncbi:MAG: sugar phosphate nucleotidyltransferase [Actinomycetota bacterium]|nr:sugar phosphate nucleotidyltransferase [Actinomycetota bacterium]
MLPSVVILCGGRGTRLQERTRSIPKPLVEIGGRPILWHVMQIYLAQGFRRFVLCTGYKAEMIDAFAESETWPEDAAIRCLPTGLDTPTGGRVLLAARTLEGEAFCATYADGVADIDLHAVLAFHHDHGATATMTVVRPELQFGVAELGGDGVVRGFIEKPRSDHWINGGFFCFEPDVAEVLEQDSVLEREPLERLAGRGDLRAFRHEGFWDCMDTYKDAVLLNDLWSQDRAPWKLWS